VETGELTTLLLVSVIAVASPFVSDVTRRWVLIPGVVIEIVLGIVIGPDVLDLATIDSVISAFAEIGLVFLIFLAGYEVDVAKVLGRPLDRALRGWLLSLVLGVVVATTLHTLDVTTGIRFVAIALSTTAIGTLFPILSDAGILGTRLGTFTLAGGAVGELGPIVAISIALASDTPARSALVVVAFAALAAAAAWLAGRPSRPRMVALIADTLHSSGQFGVRIAVLFCVALIWVADEWRLDILLGAFAAGMVTRLFLVRHSETPVEIDDRSIDNRSEVSTRIEALGFGFFIPLFFVTSGVRFDLSGLAEVGSMLKVPMFLALLLVVRGLPAWLCRNNLPPRDVRALALFQATALPLIVVITGIGVDSGQMRADNAAALVGAGLLSVIVFPMLGLAMRSRDDLDAATVPAST
jgi:Kef-type K+ transport system membrane component KefB